MAHTSFGGARLSITLEAVHLQASPSTIGVLMSLMMVVPTFVSVAIGRWADRAGFVRPTLAGLALLALAEAIAAAHASVPALGLASVLVGTGYTLAHVAVNNAIGHAAGPADRVRAFGLTAMGFSVSAFAGPLFAGVAIDHLGHAWAFACLALLPLVSALMVRGLPVPRAPGPATAVAPGDSGALGLLRHAPLRAVLMVSALVSVGWDLFTFLVPLFAARQGLSATLIGVVVGAFGVGTFAARLSLPWMARRWGEWTLLRATVALTALGYFAFPFCTGAVSMIPLAFAIGLALGGGQPVVMSLLHHTAPPARTGEAVGLRAAVTSVSQTTLPLLFGALGAAVGMFPLFWTAGGVLLAGAFAARSVRPASAADTSARAGSG